MKKFWRLFENEDGSPTPLLGLYMPAVGLWLSGLVVIHYWDFLSIYLVYAAGTFSGLFFGIAIGFKLFNAGDSQQDNDNDAKTAKQTTEAAGPPVEPVA